MKTNEFFNLFLEELEDMFSAEHQIGKALPDLIKQASLPELKEALSKHLKETEHQVQRIEKIFSMLGMKPKEETCEGMKGIIEEGKEMVKGKAKSAILDAAIISAAQKVEHYEIASYGTLRSFAEFLDLDDDIVDLIQENLDEEGAADKKLTKIAEGSLFTSGINKEAVDTSEKKSRR